jgi:hypothetical protein
VLEEDVALTKAWLRGRFSKIVWPVAPTKDRPLSHALVLGKAHCSPAWVERDSMHGGTWQDEYMALELTEEATRFCRGKIPDESHGATR